jgi:ribonucleoside-diphosphate reductase alpha chain
MREQQARERLPDERNGRTLHFTILNRVETNAEVAIEEVKGYCTVGEYTDGRLGEVFVKLGKPGEERALLDQWGIAASIALQRGAGIRELFGKHVGTRFEPYGAVRGVVGIERCTSVLDLISRWVILKYEKETS